MDALQTDAVRIPSRQMIRDYDAMDFCDDFEDFCEFYMLPFAHMGRVEGGARLKQFIYELRERTAKNRGGRRTP